MDLPVRARFFPLLWFLFAFMTAPVRAAMTEQGRLLAFDSVAHDWFGYSIATSGDTAIVGSVYGNRAGGGSGAAYLFVRHGASWFEQFKLVSSVGEGVDYFGSALAISGDTAVVAAQFGRPELRESGAVHVFVRSGSGWHEQARLLGPDAQEGDGFGYSVAISGDTLVVGAYGSDNSPSRLRTGAAYVFVRSGSTWSFQAKLVASDGSYADSFGTSVAITADTVMVGAPGWDLARGAAYVFVRNGSSWTEHAKLLPSGIAQYALFGWAVAMSGDTALVGAPYMENLGAAYVFVRNGSSWSEHAELLASAGEIWDQFGTSVAISGDTLVVGAVGRDYSAGAAYVYVRRGSSWTGQAELLASNRATHHLFGSSVAIAGATALVCAPHAEESLSARLIGMTYLFPAPGVRVTPARLLTIEGGDPSAFTVSLSTEPTGDVVIDLASSNPDEGMISPAQLTFTTGDWSTPQTVTLHGVDDFVTDNGQPYTVDLLINQELTEDVVYDELDPPNVSAVNLEFAGDFYTVPPCRVIDTRQPEQQPSLTSGVERVVSFHDTCGVPATARAVAVNVTVVQPTGNGYLSVYPHDLPHPGPMMFTFQAGQNRANNATVLLATDGTGTMTAAPFVELGGSVDLIIDLAGYFE